MLWSVIFRRPWLGVPFGLWVIVSLSYYWWLISRISNLESPSVSRVRMKSYPVSEQTSYLTDPSCETIQISMVCMGPCTTNFTPMMKSLLAHRQNPLHFHFIVDNNSQQIINKLFDTWDLPDVKYTCYNAQDQMSKVYWIPNSHYSGVYIFFKLLYPDILPRALHKVIILDSDLTFLSDIAELWSFFKNMTDQQLIGLVENESEWYFKSSQWPALGQGYNTGVMLLNLHNIHTNVNWTSLWHEAVEENMKTLKKTSLGDQDIINAVIKKYPHLVYNISCHYNVQMSTKTLAKNCYGNNTKLVKIIHWNSPKKQEINVTDAAYFRSLHHGYVNLDGNLLREKLYRCWTTEYRNVTGKHSELCTSFRAASSVKLRTHPYYVDYRYVVEDDFDVTLVLQLSIDRLQFLERFVKYWEGPISAAIYLGDCDVTKLGNFIKDWSNVLKARKNIGYHLVFKHDAVHYPVNYLRNVALEHVTTPYVFLMDADFVPMEGLYEHLRQVLRIINPYPQKKCLVVPAFETQRYRARPPRSKPQLLSRLSRAAGGRARTPDVAPFRSGEWPRGHRATNYTRWAHATAPYEVEWEPDYEPYLVVHHTVPKYDIRFSGFGWNKVSHIVHLRALGYRAVVLPAAFVLHTTHAPSADITAFRADPHYRICLALLKQEFLEDLSKKYNVSLEEHKPDAVDLNPIRVIGKTNDELQRVDED